MRKLYVVTMLLTAGLLVLATGAKGADLDDLFKFSNGARPVGMGDAFVGVADDINAIYYNPAGLGILKLSELSTMTATDDFIDRKTNMLSYAHRLSATDRGGALGIKFVLDDYGETPIAVTVVGGRPVAVMGEEKETKYIFGYGVRMDENLAVGASVRGINYDLGGNSASGWGLDVGALYMMENGLNLGINLQNVIQTSLGDDSIPMNIKFGVAYKGLENDNLTMALDYDTQVAGDGIIHAGFDYQLTNQFAFRMGMNDKNLSLGLGLSMSNLSLDYAFQDKEEGNQSVISLSYKLPAGKKEKAAAPVVRQAPVAGKIFDTRVAVIEPGRVLINLGSSDGMSKGLVVDVYSGGKKVGQSTIDLVGKFFCKGSFKPDSGVMAGTGQDVGDQIVVPQ